MREFDIVNIDFVLVRLELFWFSQSNVKNTLRENWLNLKVWGSSFHFLRKKTRAKLLSSRKNFFFFQEKITFARKSPRDHETQRLNRNFAIYAVSRFLLSSPSLPCCLSLYFMSRFIPIDSVNILSSVNLTPNVKLTPLIFGFFLFTFFPLFP